MDFSIESPPGPSRGLPGALANPTESYNAQSIQILSSETAKQRFPFALAVELAVRYPSVSPRFIERLVEACRLVDYPVENAILRYLDKDKSVTVTPELLECFKDLSDQRRR